MKRKTSKRILSVVLALAAITSMCISAYATDYDKSTQTGAMKTVVKVSESEGFKVSIPAEATISWATATLETSLEFKDVLLASGHTLKFNIYGLSTDYDSDEHKLVLRTTDNDKIYLDVFVDDEEEAYDGENSTIFTIAGSVASETHTVTFKVDKAFEDESGNKNFPVTGKNYSGNIVYNVIIN